MFSKLRPLIFKIDPERAHNLAIQSLKFNLVSNVFDENQSQEEMDKALFSKFDGMTSADMEAYGVENDLIGCLSELNEFCESLKEFGESLGDL